MHKETINAVKNADKRDPKDGWAPGGYMNMCTKCREAFLGDKYASTCASCAYECE